MCDTDLEGSCLIGSSRLDQGATKGRIQRSARGGTMASASNPANIPTCVLFVMDHTKKLIVQNSREGELYMLLRDYLVQGCLKCSQTS